MARLKGGSYVAGNLTVEGVLRAGSFATTGGITFAHILSTMSAQANYVPKFNASGSAEFVKSIITDDGSTVTVAGALTATGDIKGASVYIEEDANSSYYLRLLANSDLTANHTLTINTSNADRILSLYADLTISTAAKTLTGEGTTLTMGGNITTSGAYALTMTLTGTTSITLPTSGTLATLENSETFSAAKTFSNTVTLSALTASTALALNASKQITSVTNTGTGNNVLATAPYISTGIYPVSSNGASLGNSSYMWSYLALVAGSKISFGSDGTQALLNNSATAMLTWTGDFTANKVYNAVWNDIADFIQVEEECKIEPGYAYTYTKGVHRKTRSYAEKGSIGITSDTYGFGLGHKPSAKELPIAIGGFVLAYCDRLYEPGTPLTSGRDGKLIKARLLTRLFHPERLLATFYRPEAAEKWHSVAVNGRCWVKVK